MLITPNTPGINSYHLKKALMQDLYLNTLKTDTISFSSRANLDRETQDIIDNRKAVEKKLLDVLIEGEREKIFMETGWEVY